ncbi:MAG: tetratricopeptide repeat protein [Myxococcales bacterium]|nr:tetratricopeptide repeat protein [Myxococcales bacterium]
MNQLWKRISSAQHTVIVGPPPGAPPQETGLRVIRVACDRHGGPLQPIREAQEKVDGIVGWPIHLLGTATDTLRRGLRESLLGENQSTDDADRLAQSLARLASRSPRRHVVIFDASDTLSAPAANVLGRLLRVPGLVSVPLVFSARQVIPGSPFATLIDQLVAVLGNEAVIQIPDQTTNLDKNTDVVNALPQEVRNTLRMAALIGDGFEAEVLAEALGVSLVDVLLRLQVAVDAGVPLDDSGEGVFHFGQGLRQSLTTSLLPSLQRLMHLKIAAVFTGPEAQTKTDTRAGNTRNVTDTEPATEVDFLPSNDERQLEADDGKTQTAVTREQNEFLMQNGSNGAVDDVQQTRTTEPRTTAFVKRSEDEFDFEPAPPRKGAAMRATEIPRPGKHGRAAEHLAAGGEDNAALTQFLQAAHRALFMGNPIDGIVYSQRALALLDGMTQTPQHEALRAEALLLLAQGQFEAPVHETRSGLADALSTVQSALTLFEEAQDVEKTAASLSLSARIHYEIGDSASMEAALAELTRAIELLAAAGNPLGAARLLNDQASVFLRIGDPVRAYRLLEQSKETFLARANDDPIAMVELAETEHLIARLPLHVAARAGKESDSVRMGLEHAEAANQRYARLGMDREAARVWETMGRLHLLGGRATDAVPLLEKALRVQIELGDVIGMARTVEALATGLAAMGRTSEALDLLGESIELNLMKGSPRGIAYLNTTFEKVTEELRPEQRELLAGRISDLKQHLQVAGDLIASDHSHVR